ncbi:hypothetical protein [Microbispora sp. NBRC 16548]|uniref:hypothetical protein n=1 Tax=Microbispora sp. NBRC 16548 TaxID=3030994 RepID=UPI0024A5C9B0|nr:hypothetical protein [Microbispora sp. NBRC 16548]GLX03335.1 hypothetical protein Misp03_02620 [Microbispora sp. NBRC 16548]
MAYQQGPPGQPPYGPPPGYGYPHQPGYPPQPPPKKSNVGLILAVIGVLLLLLLGGCFAVVVVAANKGAEEVNKAISQLTPFPSFPVDADGPKHEVVFEAEGDGGADSASNITYTSGFDLKQEAGVSLPFTKSRQLAEGTPIVSLWVQNAADQGTVTCRIKVDGKTVRQAKSTGPYGVCRVQVNSLGE